MITGQQLKQDGQQKVLSNHSAEFKAEMINKLSYFCKSNKKSNINEFRIEHFRRFCEINNLIPNHPNFWGGFAGIAIKEGLIKPTGRYEKAVSPKTHHHPVMVYEII